MDEHLKDFIRICDKKGDCIMSGKTLPNDCQTCIFARNYLIGACKEELVTFQASALRAATAAEYLLSELDLWAQRQVKA